MKLTEPQRRALRVMSHRGRITTDEALSYRIDRSDLAHLIDCKLLEPIGVWNITDAGRAKLRENDGHA